MLKQAERNKERNRHRKNSSAKPGNESRIPKTALTCRFHRVLQEKLARHETNERDQDKNEREKGHNRSSRRATGLATMARPMITSTMPHQRRAEIISPRKTQQLNGTRTSTTRESGKAIVSGMYFKT